jgi:hypothetical protein
MPGNDGRCDTAGTHKADDIRGARNTTTNQPDVLAGGARIDPLTVGKGLPQRD